MKKKKIGILTLHNSYNYGALLQAFATYKFLSKRYESVFIDYQNKFEKKYNKIFSYRKTLSLKQNLLIYIKNTFFRSFYWCSKSFNEFIKSLPKTDKVIDSDLLKYNFDIIISGSDQIWNPEIFGNIIDEKYLLNFKTTAKKISYASSLGSYNIEEKNKNIFKKNLSKFSKISVRETYAKDKIEKIIDKDIKVVCDPTMLLSKKEWSLLIDKQNVKIPKEKYILVYLMSKFEDYEEIIVKYAKNNNLKIAFVTFSNIKRNNIDYYFKGLNPLEFLYAIKNSEIVFTNSFHGTIFSLILNKEFYSLYFQKNPKRCENLLDKFDLSNRLVKNYEDILQSQDIDFCSINKKIEEISEDSKNWLINSIEGE